MANFIIGHSKYT